MRLSELEAVVESLLFIAGDAVSLASIAQTIEPGSGNDAGQSCFPLRINMRRKNGDCGLWRLRTRIRCVRRQNALNISAICIKAHSGRD